ncbi:condensation domain-containing protein [Streptomyces antarcticus]|uniref:condensation domain-containing protein n=1 Tax=Streptomyces antarcticus TaxID=2996458 RepID=UPI00226EB4BE|nr:MULTISPECIES: condensation domain-containing protein [unclassified Streptomyces]MCY0944140.1 condensation domain-containing protein [Streptomyces sp. H34-AA3]MCZ4086734.1 condensation domain-containing protein [Streptomyces sp. H34-S5]
MPDGQSHQLAPLSLTQEQLWFLTRLDPGSAFYNTTATWTLTGPLDTGALHTALARTMDRQHMLRTAVTEVDGVPSQVLVDDVPVPLTVSDLTGLPEPERAAAADRLVSEEVHVPFDLAAAPLFRVRLIRTGPDEHVMVFVMHHIIADGWSLQVLIQEVADLYAAAVTGTEVEHAPLERQFADYAVRQRERLAGPRRDKLVSYWGERLAGSPTALDLPTDRPRPAEATFRGDRYAFTVPQDLHLELTALGRAAGASLFMTCLAGFGVLLSRWSGQSDVLLGTPVGNRDRPEWSPVVGYFADTLVMRTELADDPTFAELLTRVRRSSLDAFVHRDLPFRVLVEELKPERVPHRNPLFQVMFILQNIPPRRRNVEFAGLVMALREDVRTTSIFDLRLDLFQSEHELRGQLEYNTDLFDRSTAERLAGQYLALLADACAEPGTRVSALSLGAPPADPFGSGFNDDLEEA